MDLQSQPSTDTLANLAMPALRMTAQEAEAVVRLWQQEQADAYGLTNRPSLADVAEGLDIAPEDARRLLAQARRTQFGSLGPRHTAQADTDAQAARIAQEHRKLARRMAWGTAAAALAAWLVHFLH